MSSSSFLSSLGVTDEVWMVLQNVDPSTRQPSEDPSPSISVLSFEGHRLLDSLKSFPVVSSGISSSASTVSSKNAVGKDSAHDEDDTTEKETASCATPTTPVAHSISHPEPLSAAAAATAAAASAHPPASHSVQHIVSVLNHVWLCDSAGYIHVYCALSYQPLLSFPVSTASTCSRRSSLPRTGATSSSSSSSSSSSRASHALQLLYVAAANQVFAALSDGNLVFCNVVTVAAHLPGFTDMEESVSVEHKWLSHTLMQVRGENKGG